MTKKTKKDYSSIENLKEEQALWAKGYTKIAGVDECGRGPFAGPVVACAVIMPKDVRIERLTDSKKVPKSEHKAFANFVKERAIAYAIGVATVEEIDAINIKQASRLAMKRAIEGLEIPPDYILVDGTEVIDTTIPQHYLIKGDYHSHTISAAAIVAKVYRDELMATLDEQYGNVYNWKHNAGYQTEAHIGACKLHGVTKHHRKSWKTMELFQRNHLK